MQADKKEEKSPLELPEPEEKLLRSPTFFEKYGWVKPVSIIIVLLTTIILSVLYLLGTDDLDSDKTSMQPEIISQAPSPTAMINAYAGWKTYVSTEGLYSIKYPADYTLYENISGSPNTSQIYSNVLPNINTNFRLTITHKSTNTQTLQQLINENKICAGITTSEGTPSIINGEKLAQIYVDTPCGSYPTTVVYTLNNGILYIISIETQSKYDQIKEYTDQILTTLKFLELEQSFCTQDALECPDGSWVGRSGPNCEFICPAL